MDALPAGAGAAAAEAQDGALRLSAGAWEAALLPARGGAFAALTHAGREVLAPVPPGADPNQGFHGAFWMLPWANRLDGGRIRVGGAEHRLSVNRPTEGTAIHGLMRDRPWEVAAHDSGAARLVLLQRLDGPEAGPFRCCARAVVELSATTGLRLDLVLTNTGDAATPMGAGWHPFFRRTPDTRLRFAASVRFDRDARGLPVDARPCPGLGAPVECFDGLDAHFAGWRGTAEIARPDLTLRLRATGAWARNLQVFAPAGGDVLCVEPMSHAPDASNRAEAAAHGPMSLLAPGESLRASLGLSCA